MQISKSINNKGISLLEVLIVISVFAILGVLVTRSIMLTLSGSKKSENLIRVRENLNYSIGIIERNLRNANSIPDCTNSNTLQIGYMDQDGNPSTFSCVNIGTNGYVASGSAKLSSDSVNVTNCSFTCALSPSGSPSSVTVNLSAQDFITTGVQNSAVTASTQILLRNY